MSLSAKQLGSELGEIRLPSFADAIVDSYVEMQQRFFVGDWKPASSMAGISVRPFPVRYTNWIPV